MNLLFREVRTPPRSPSPDCLYRTEKENFERNNPGFFYDFDKVERLKEIWTEYVSADYEWDLDLKVIRRKLFTLDNFDQVEELQKVNVHCFGLQVKNIDYTNCPLWRIPLFCTPFWQIIHPKTLFACFWHLEIFNMKKMMMHYIDLWNRENVPMFFEQKIQIV